VLGDHLLLTPEDIPVQMDWSFTILHLNANVHGSFSGSTFKGRKPPKFGHAFSNLAHFGVCGKLASSNLRVNTLAMTVTGNQNSQRDLSRLWAKVYQIFRECGGQLIT